MSYLLNITEKAFLTYKPCFKSYYGINKNLPKIYIFADHALYQKLL